MKQPDKLSDKVRLPENLPKPKNDGQADHLLHIQIPKITLPSNIEKVLDVTKINSDYLVLYFFPMMIAPGENIPSEWNDIPGARGCTPQNITITEHSRELEKYNAVPIGISTQRIEELIKISTLMNFSHILASDHNLKFQEKLLIPVFDFNNKTMYKRLTIIVKNSKIVKVFYPIFPPDKHIFEILKWFEEKSIDQN